MKKILLPLSLSLLIVFALFLVASPKKIAAPAKDSTEIETASGTDRDSEIAAFPSKASENGTSDEKPSSEVSDNSGTLASSGSTLSETSASSGATNDTTTDGTVCTDEYAPVCGEDGRTYPNICAAGRMKANATPGACASEKSDDASVSDGSETSASEPTANASSGSSAVPSVNGLPYDNASLGYGFVLPKSSYFSGFGAQGGASHAVGISKNASPESFELAEVKVKLYKNKVLSQLKNAENGFYEDSETGTTYLLLSGSTLTVEGDRSMFSGIMDSIIKSAYVR